MNLLRLFRLSRELSRMEKKAKANPSPSSFVDLAQVYINLGWHGHTMRIAEEGLARFPRSEELRKVQKFASKHLLGERVQELRQKITKTPTAKLYRELARIYADMGDQSSVVSTCQECLRRFPDDVETHILLAAEKTKSFYRTLSAAEGREIVAGLLRALEIDYTNVQAHKQLAEVYFRIGAVRHAQEHVDFLRDRYPDDDEVKALVKEIGSGLTNGEDPERLFATIQERHALPGRAASEVRRAKGVAPDAVMDGIREGLEQLVDIEGVQKAAYIRGSKALVKGDIRDGRDPFLKVVRVVAKASHRAARRMELGSFSRATIDGSFGHICVCSAGDVCAAVQCERSTSVERIAGSVQELLAASLHPVGQPED